MKKICTTCKIEKLISEFHRQLKTYRGRCKKCCSIYFKQYRLSHVEELKKYHDAHRKEKNAVSKKYAQTHKEKLKNGFFLRKYNLGTQEVMNMLKAQACKCPICQTVMVVGGHGKNSVHVDHDHETGMVRGLLCSNCNHGLGNFQDNLGSLLRAYDYLKRSKLPIDKNG